jgi:hypothetical protein
VQMVPCQRVRYVTECVRSYRPYTTCRMVPETVRSCVPRTTCHLEAYCQRVPVCRMVPYCEPVCEPACPPAPPAACGGTHRWHTWLAGKLSSAGCCGN